MLLPAGEDPDLSPHLCSQEFHQKLTQNERIVAVLSTSENGTF